MPRQDEDATLSVVIPARNEEQRIEACLKSVVDAVKAVPGAEVLLVDSGSTDRTIEIAMGYPIRILQLAHWDLATASAGIYLGTVHATGNVIQVLGSDCVLDPNWLRKGMDFLNAHPEIVGVQGLFSQRPYQNPLAMMYSKSIVEFSSNPEGPSTRGIAFGAAVMLRKDALVRSGHYNPFLVAYEESDLNSRLKRMGASVWFLKVPMATHMGYETYRTGDIYRKMMSYKRGYGQTLRLEARRSRGLRRRAWTLYVAFRGFAAITLEIAALYVALVWQSYALLVLAVLLGAALFSYKAAKSGSIHRSAVFLRDLHIEWPWIIRGFLGKPREAMQYPTEVLVLKQ